MHYPLDYAKALIDEQHGTKFSKEDDLVLEFIRVLLNHPKEGLLENNFKKQLKNISSTRKENYSDRAKFLNKLYGNTNEIGGVLKKYTDEESYIENYKKWLIWQLNQLEESIYSRDQIDWKLYKHSICITINKPLK